MAKQRDERLVNLIICLLSTSRYLTASKIASLVPGYEHDSSDKTQHQAFQRKFERDKADLRDIGLTLETDIAFGDTELGYKIAQGYALPPVDFTAEELAIIGIAATWWKDTGLAAVAGRARQKLLAAGMSIPELTLPDTEPALSADTAVVSLIAAATLRQEIEFFYHSLSSAVAEKRRIRPWRVVARHGAWYVIGFDVRREAARCFRLSRIEGSIACKGPENAFAIPDESEIAKHVTITGDELIPHTRVLIRRTQAAGLSRLGSPCSIHPVSADTVDPEWEQVCITQREKGFLTSLILSYGPLVQVIEPEALRGQIIERLQIVVGEGDKHGH